jgi:hypothetical protein
MKTTFERNLLSNFEDLDRVIVVEFVEDGDFFVESSEIVVMEAT